MDLRHPPAEFDVGVDLARRLLKAQHPEFLVGAVRFVAEGWDNFIFRIGSDFALRIPRREVAVELLRNEQRWLPEIAARLPLLVPVPVAIGVPSAEFPHPWSVVPWIEGTTAEFTPLGKTDACLLARTLRALHQPAPEDASPNPFRGVDLRERREVVEQRLARMGLDRLEGPWRRALAAPISSAPVWLHGDLHPRNVVVRDGSLIALIDWGDLTGGDVATDLVCGWTLFGERARQAFKDAYAPTEDEWARAAGWAVHFGSAMLDSGEPAHMAIGRRVVEEVTREG